ncbi:MAG: L-iditol 2-dehydrogenase, partial [Microvirga sp.]
AGQPVTALTYRAYAEHDLARADSIIPLPEALADRPVLGEPVACAVNVMRRSGVQEGDTVVLLGTGFLGTLLLQLLRRHKPGRVIAVSRRRMDPALAERLGVEVLTYEDQVPGGADVVIEATGKQGPLDLATNLVRVRGRLIVAGYHQDGPRTVNLQLWNWRGLDVINAHERDPEVYMAGIRAAVAAVTSGRLDPRPLYTHVYPLERLGEALDATRDRPDGFLKALVTA